MSGNRIRVGVIGAAPDRGWAANAHLPALRALPQYALNAVCTTRQASADATAQRFDIPLALSDWRALVARSDIDLVIVTVKVRHHNELVMAALEAGKHVFCEWPLGLDTAQADAMRVAAERSGRRHMVGLQGRLHPVLNRLKAMVDGGTIGRLLSYTLSSSLASWGPRLPAAEEYRTHADSGATGLTIPGGHTLDSLQHCLGPFQDVSALLRTQHTEAEIIGTGRVVPVTAPDQMLVSGTLVSGAVASVHVKADMAVPMGVRLEVNGSDGDLLVTSHTLPGQDPVGIQRAELILSHAKRGTREYVAVPVAPDASLPDSVPKGAPFYTARLLAGLAAAIDGGGDTFPSFANAVATHRLLDAVQRSSDTGQRITCPPDQA